MADVKGKITTLKCGPCLFDGNSVEPTQFCVDCLEYLCTGCAREHRRHKPSCEHTLLEDSDFPPDVKLFEEMKKLSYCQKHPNVEVYQYCPHHGELICMLCLQTYHRFCEGLSDLTDLLVDESMRMKPEERIHNLQIKCKEKLNEIMPHLDEALVDINKVDKQIHDCFHILKENVDQIEKKLNQKLDTSTQRVIQLKQTLSKLEKKTLIYENMHNITSKYGTEKHRIAFNFTLSTLQKDLDEDDSVKSVINDKLQFIQPTKVEDLMGMLRRFDVVLTCRDEQESELSSDEASIHEDAMEFQEPKTRDVATQYEENLAECGKASKRRLRCLNVIHDNIRLLKFEYHQKKEIKRSVVAVDILYDGRIILLQHEKMLTLHSSKLQLSSTFQLKRNAKDMCAVQQTSKGDFTLAVCFEQSSKISILEYHDEFQETNYFNCSQNVISISMYDYHLVTLVERKSSKSSYEIQLLDIPTGHVCYTFDEFKKETSEHANYYACITFIKPYRIRACQKTNHVVLVDANAVYRFSIGDGKCENDTLYAVGQCVWYHDEVLKTPPNLKNATDVKCDSQGNMYVQANNSLYQLYPSNGRFIIRLLMKQFDNVSALAIDESRNRLVVGYKDSDRAHVYKYSFLRDR
ncbi:hypothetical protein DPMN_061907 [Dreissena polymorpha]|uniref:B box-type domain-containing protein n=1 Tax=Dreissena polymorpha TaxID=45954 RepID=A0A9D4C7V9_DREPO|nr:hypothetical protein DPMN_061907 [Dreissena polymorpha]